MVPRVLRETEQLREGDEREQQGQPHGAARHQPGGLLAERSDTDQTVEGGPETGQKRNQPDEVHYHLMIVISSMFTVSLFR